MFNLLNRTALITGASGGIGESIARTLHEQGASVTLTGRNQEKLEMLAAELGERAHVLPLNLADSEALKNLIPQAEEKMGRLDILVNNAGLTKDSLMMRMKNPDFDEVLDINLKAPFILMRAALGPMMKQKWGRIINISSIVGLTGNPGQANYCASKAGLIGMSKALALEVASRNITVNCVAPGFITTAMTDKLTDAQKEILKQNIPLGYEGKPQDIAAAVLYLASTEASYVTGQTLHVNGGMLMV